MVSLSNLHLVFLFSHARIMIDCIRLLLSWISSSSIGLTFSHLLVLTSAIEGISLLGCWVLIGGSVGRVELEFEDSSNG